MHIAKEKVIKLREIPDEIKSWLHKKENRTKHEAVANMHKLAEIFEWGGRLGEEIPCRDIYLIRLIGCYAGKL